MSIRLPFRGILVVLLASASIASMVGRAPAASTSASTVSVTVPSATTIDASGCPSATAGVTDFGVVVPGSTALTSVSCTVIAGSSNDTARLRFAQADGEGTAMWAVATNHRDAAFGTSGVVQYDPAGATDQFNDLIRLPDGKLLVAGCSSSSLIVARFTAAGALDPTFAVSGVRSIAVGTSACATDMVREASGTITVGGSATVAAVVRPLVVRLDASGTPIPSFDGDGIWYDAARTPGIVAIAVDSAGRVVWGGNSAGNAVVARLTSTGAYDATFSGGAPLVTLFVGGSEQVTSIVNGPGGTTYALGTTSIGAGQAYIARLDAAGALDTTYASGTGRIQFSGTYPRAMLDSQGRIVVAGSRQNLYARVYRFLADGSIDASFGTGGFIEFDVSAGNDPLKGVAELPDGRLVVVGATNGADQFTALISPTGVLDAEHGGGGVQVHDLVAGSDQPSAIAAARDGSVVVAGSLPATTSDGYLLQLDGGTIPDYNGGTADWNAAGGAFGACVDSIAGTGVLADVNVQAGCAQTPAAAWWQAVPATPTSLVHGTTSGVTNLTARLRFGIRVAATQRPTTYRAGLTFDVLAPG